MKKYLISLSSLFVALNVMPVFALSVSGTVRDDEDVLIGANVRAIDSSGKMVAGSTTDSDGRFNIDIPNNAKLQISYVGYETKIIEKPVSNLDIKLGDNTNTLKEVEKTSTHKEGDPCSGKPLTDKHPHAAGGKGQWKKINDTWSCVPISCEQKYELKNNKCVEIRCDEVQGYEFNSNTNQCDKTECSVSEKEAVLNANGTEPKWDGKKCIPTACSDGWNLKGNKCIHDKCTKPEEDWVDGKCVKTRCTDNEKQAIHAEDGQWDEANKKCIANKCDEKVYTLKDGICDLIDKRDDDEKQSALEKKQKAYDEAKKKEQSFENRMLTAATVAATGIGGMELMQGMAEQSADKDATADMTAYIETMRCTYGEGKQVKAGTEEIELPGANDETLMKLRAEYLALATDLKERKEALGMKAGIESEEILDRASSGLYDDESIGISNGAYASLYRAQMLQSEADKKKIDDAASTSKNRVTGGAIAAGAGVVVGIAGNSLLNGKLGEAIKNKKENKDEESSLESINKKNEPVNFSEANTSSVLCDHPKYRWKKEDKDDVIALLQKFNQQIRCIPDGKGEFEKFHKLSSEIFELQANSPTSATEDKTQELRAKINSMLALFKKKTNIKACVDGLGIDPNNHDLRAELNEIPKYRWKKEDKDDVIALLQKFNQQIRCIPDEKGEFEKFHKLSSEIFELQDNPPTSATEDKTQELRAKINSILALFKKKTNIKACADGLGIDPNNHDLRAELNYCDYD